MSTAAVRELIFGGTRREVARDTRRQIAKDAANSAAATTGIAISRRWWQPGPELVAAKGLTTSDIKEIDAKYFWKGVGFLLLKALFVLLVLAGLAALITLCIFLPPVAAAACGCAIPYWGVLGGMVLYGTVFIVGQTHNNYWRAELSTPNDPKLREQTLYKAIDADDTSALIAIYPNMCA
jgi:hypothetical protein